MLEASRIAAGLAREKDHDIANLQSRAAADKQVDLESWEFGMRQAILAAGVRYLEQLL